MILSSCNSFFDNFNSTRYTSGVVYLGCNLVIVIGAAELLDDPIRAIEELEEPNGAAEELDEPIKGAAEELEDPIRVIEELEEPIRVIEELEEPTDRRSVSVGTNLLTGVVSADNTPFG
jgi:hypothetical protein